MPPKRYIPITGPGKWNELPESVISNILKYVEFKKKNWISCICVCKKWSFVGKSTFDPSVNDSLALRLAW